VDCAALGYQGQQPFSDAAVALADQGYYALSCRGGNSRIFDIMEPYKEVSTFLIFLVVIGRGLADIVPSIIDTHFDTLGT